MTESQIIQIVKGYINDAVAGMSKENPKLDFKGHWYDLTIEDEINEFIKDSSSIANTPGLDGFIIIGFDERERKFNHSIFLDSKLKDSHELVGMILKRVDRSFHIACYDIDINGHKLSILHLPPSFDKPHVIKCYTSKKGKTEEHRVFIRYGSTIRIATKYDLDFIAYDRKNNIPEYSIFISVARSSILPMRKGNHIELNPALVIENNGLRPIAITEIILSLIYTDRTVVFISIANREEKLNSNISASNIIIQPATIASFMALQFTSQRGATLAEYNEFHKTSNSFHAVMARIKLNTGQIMETKIHLI